jgi:hypothetical protein
MCYAEVRLDKVMRALFGGNPEGGVSVLHTYDLGSSTAELTRKTPAMFRLRSL